MWWAKIENWHARWPSWMKWSRLGKMRYWVRLRVRGQDASDVYYVQDGEAG